MAGRNQVRPKTVIVRSIARLANVLTPSDTRPDDKHRVLQAAFENPDFRILVRLARDFASANTITQALERTLAVAFEALHIHRGFILLQQPNGELRCEILRVRERVEHRPKAAVPVSTAILREVLQQRIALVTADASTDRRFQASDSISQHGIRSAMCVPLWSAERIIGFMQVDSPVWVRNFDEHDLDFLIALANFAAVTVERLREQQARNRLQRYHPPALVEQVLQDEGPGATMQPLVRAEVTVLFADLAGFTEMTEAAEPEQVAELLGTFFTKAADAIFAEGGTLDKFIGDCVMAFFGAPVGEARHAPRAISAALRLLDAMDAWNAERSATQPQLKVHIGVNSGLVVVGDVGSEGRADYTVLGSTVNLAARLQQEAAPGEILLGSSTRALVRDDFDVELVGEMQLRGWAQPLSMYRVQRGGTAEKSPTGPSTVRSA